MNNTPNRITQKFGQFWHTPKYRLLVIVLTISVLLCDIWLALPDKLEIKSEGMNYPMMVYNDSSMGGNSEILDFEVSDTLITFQFMLKDGIGSPFVGMSFSGIDYQPMDLSAYNTMILNLESENLDGVAVSFFTEDENLTDSYGNHEVWFQKVFQISSKPGTYEVDLNDINPPDWWMERTRVTADQIPPLNTAAVKNINIGAAYAPHLDEKAVLKIREISFVAQKNLELIWVNAIWAGSLLIIFLAFLIKKNNPIPQAPSAAIKIEYTPVETPAEEHEINEILAYINQTFSDSALTIEQVAKATGFSTRKVSAQIQDSVKCNFKTYLNQLRINESKRLLQSTDLNIGEVAYKVGFGNQSHFNRVFKQIEKMSPSQYKSSFKA